MIDHSLPFSGFSVRDVKEAATFYTDVLDLEATVEEGGMGFIHLGGGHAVLFYPKGDDHEPASFTVLNLPVDDVRASVRDLTERGVTFEHYDSMAQDDDGILTGEGPDIAWFTDPSGNVFSLISR